MRRFVKFFFIAVALFVIALIGAYLLRPKPAHGAATIPQWVKTLDTAYVKEPSRAFQPFKLLGAGTAYFTLKDAVTNAKDGDTISIAPGTYRKDCAVVHEGQDLTIRAETPGTVTFVETLCEGKATLVLRGGAVTVEGLRFRGLHTYDANAAGIRAETGQILVRDSTFEDSENGILGNVIRDGSVTIEHSIFRHLGGCPPDKKCAHSLYLGEIGQVSIRNSLFQDGTGGHYLKLRGPKVDVQDNLIDDSHGGATSYLIDLPNGASGIVAGNTLVKGPKADNRCCGIIIGEEGETHPTSVDIRNNTAVNLTDRPVILVADLTGKAHVGANDMRGWWVKRSGTLYKGRCLGCGLINKLKALD